MRRFVLAALGVCLLALPFVAMAQFDTNTAGGDTRSALISSTSQGLTINSSGADSNSSIRCDTNANCFVVDAGAFSGVGAVGVGVAPGASGLATLEVSRPATTAVANADYYTMLIDNDAAITIPTGTATNVVSLWIDEPNITATGTCSNGASFWVNGAPTECSNNYAAVFSGGTVLFSSNTLNFSSVAASHSGTFVTTGTISQTPTTITPAAAATSFAVSRMKHVIDCDAGGNTIGTITGGVTNTTYSFRFVDASCTITDTGTDASNTVNLSAAFTSTDDDILVLEFDGTSWREASRAVN